MTSAIETALTELSANLRRMEQRHQATGYKFDRLYGLIDAAREELAVVSQDGWAKVLERTVTDLHDLAAALQSGKIVAHVPTHLTDVALAAATGCEASAGLIRSGIAQSAE